MKLGKLPFVHDARDLRLSAYLTKLPMPPVEFGHEPVISPNAWEMLGNDAVGDCVIAAIFHLIMEWTASSTGKPARFTDREAIKTYSAITGYDPNDPNTDRGTMIRDALLYWQKHGVTDADGKTHKLGAFVAVNFMDIVQVMQARYLFGGVLIGVRFPQTAMDQFEKNEVWTPIEGTPTPDEGHCVVLAGHRDAFEECVTWGRIQPIAQPFLNLYMDEAWIALSSEALQSDGTSLEGFDLATLKTDLVALRQA